MSNLNLSDFLENWFDGDPFTGYHREGPIFVDIVGQEREAEAWVQWEESYQGLEISIGEIASKTK